MTRKPLFLQLETTNYLLRKKFIVPKMERSTRKRIRSSRKFSFKQNSSQRKVAGSRKRTQALLQLLRKISSVAQDQKIFNQVTLRTLNFFSPFFSISDKCIVEKMLTGDLCSQRASFVLKSKPGTSFEKRSKIPHCAEIK